MAEHVVSKKLYVAIFAALIVLTYITVFVATIDFGPLNIVVALTIAVVKGTLVVLYFMHVRYGNRLTWVVVGASFFWILILFAFLLGDYLSRPWETVAGW